MHEVSLCQSVLQTLTRELTARGIRPENVTCVTLSVGILRQVVPQFMQDAFRLLTSDTPLQNCRLELKIVPLQASCRRCERSFSIDSLSAICPGCGSQDVSIRGGDELQIESVTVETEGDDWSNA